MTRLLEQAIEAARQLSDEEQDELARTIMDIVKGGEEDDALELTAEDEAAINIGLTEADRGEFVSDDRLKKILSKYRA